MKRITIQFVLFLVGTILFLLACRTADLLGGAAVAEATPTRAHSTRASQRPTFTPIPPPTETLVPTETPEPTETLEPTEPPPPPTATRRPATARPRPTNTLPPPTAQPTPQPSPTQVFDWVLNGAQSCAEGAEDKTRVTGKITANSKGAIGQRVQGSAGPGGEPISDNPTPSDKDGNYEVFFGKANGDFWIWMIDPSGRQISPFVKFHFDSGCRIGKQNFQKR